MARRLTPHRPADAPFVDALQDVEDERPRVLPAVFVAGDFEPRWLTTVRRWFGR
jgi:hypothetical protein